MHRQHPNSTRIVSVLRRQACRRGDDGASLVEYALLLALIAVVAIGALVFLGNSVSNTLNTVANSVGSSSDGSAGSGTAASFEVVNPGGGTSDPFTFFVFSSGGSTSSSFSSENGTGGVTYSLRNAPQGVSVATSKSPVLTVGNSVSPGTYSFQVIATDSASPPDTATRDVTLTVEPFAALVDSLFGITSYDGCVVSSGTSLTGTCSRYSWLEQSGLFIYDGSSWKQIVDNPSSTQIDGQDAYSYGVDQNPWSCAAKTTKSGKTYCTTISINDGTLSSPDQGALGASSP